MTARRRRFKRLIRLQNRLMAVHDSRLACGDLDHADLVLARILDVSAAISHTATHQPST